MTYEFDKDLRSIQEVRNKVAQAKHAQKEFSEFSQERVDAIVAAMCAVAEQNAAPLAKMAKEETGYGRWQDKVVKNIFAATMVYKAIKGMKTVGVLKEDAINKIIDIAVPMGVIAALIPSTNPTSTVIFKALVGLKAGNALVFSPHPTAVKCITETVRLLSDAAVRAGAPEDILSCLTIPTMGGTNALMTHKDVSLILATGGEPMVRAAYSSGTPAIGVGPGNGPAFIERSADIPKAVRQILESKTFDNGVICASEQAIIVEQEVRETVIAEMQRQGFYFLSEEASEKLGRFLLRPNLTMNPAIVGRDAQELATLAGLNVPADAKVLVSHQNSVGHDNPYSREKLTTVLAFYTEPDWERACLRCLELLGNEGKGHTMTIHSRNEAVIREFALKKNVSRLLINTPAALGGIGASTALFPSLTLGCGAMGGSSTSDNVGPMNLLNIRRAAYGTCEMSDLTRETREADSVTLHVSPSLIDIDDLLLVACASSSNVSERAGVEDLVRQIMKGV